MGDRRTDDMGDTPVSAGVRVGVDLGGTKIEAVGFCEGQGEDGVLVRRRVATPAGDYEGTVAAVAELVAGIEGELGLAPGCPVGVAHPGSTIPSSGRIQNANSTVLNGRRLGADLERALGRGLGDGLRLANDADCFAASEAHDGAGAGARSVFGVILGTGVGGGLVVEGALLRGANGVAGEWGHNPLVVEDSGELPRCWCGRRGCVEAYLSGPALARDHAMRTGEARSAEQICAAAKADPSSPSRASLERYADRLARALAGVINLVDPEVIVLGGGLSKCAALYELVPARWGAHVFCDLDALATRLAPPRFGDSSGVRGAAKLGL